MSKLGEGFAGRGAVQTYNKKTILDLLKIKSGLLLLLPTTHDTHGHGGSWLLANKMHISTSWRELLDESKRKIDSFSFAGLFSADAAPTIGGNVTTQDEGRLLSAEHHNLKRELQCSLAVVIIEARHLESRDGQTLPSASVSCILKNEHLVRYPAYRVVSRSAQTLIHHRTHG